MFTYRPPMKTWLIYTLAAASLWGLWGFLPKLAVQHIDARSATIYEILGAVPFALLLASQMQFRLDVQPKGVIFALATGALSFFAVYCFFQAMVSGPVTLVVALSSIYPAITLVLAILILQESISLRQGLGLLLAVLAGVLIAG